MAVQFACWSKRYGDTTGLSGGIIGIGGMCMGGRCINNHFCGTQVREKRFPVSVIFFPQVLIVKFHFYLKLVFPLALLLE